MPETGPVLQSLFLLWPWCQLSPSLVVSLWLLPSLGGGAVWALDLGRQCKLGLLRTPRQKGL